jgi:hypothetical protein
MTKIDFKKEYKTLYNTSAKEVTAVKVPALNFLMIDGHGDPNKAQSYVEAVEALYAVAYTLKFAIKKKSGDDFAVMPLEGLWWVEDMRQFDVTKKDDWDWTMMIMQPKFVNAKLVQATLPEVAKKKDLPGLSKIRFETYTEGQAAQILHFGPYSAEGPNIVRVHEFIKQNGHHLRGKHHEIYLNDPRRVAPEKMKTIIRQPFE